MLSSLTGGGGMSASSSATATNGDFGSDQSYKVGNMTFGASSGMSNQMVMVAGLAVLALMIWKK